MKSILGRLTPSTLVGLLGAALTCLAAFGLPVTAAQTASILVFGGALSTILLAHGLSKAFTYLSPQTVVGLVTAAIGIAISFGAPITSAQSEAVLLLAGGIAGLLLVHGVVHTVARDRRRPASVSELVFREPAKTSTRGMAIEQWHSVVRAKGVHAHPTLKTGLKETDPDKPILNIDAVLTGITPPASEDRYSGVTFGLDGNDRFGDCGPTSVDNNRRSTSKVATGTQRTAQLADVYNLYRSSGNPNFNPNQSGTEDNGVEMGAMLDALMQVGLGGDKPVAFGRANDMSDAAIERLVAVFGGVLFAVNLQTAQQAQSEGASPTWDRKQSSEWGGHAIYCGKYKQVAGGVDAPVISWAKEIGTTDAFRKDQLEEVWVVIWPWHLEHPAFLEGVDLAALAAEFKALTGKELPIPAPTPQPQPAPGAGPSDADKALWASAEDWVTKHRHTGEAKQVAADLLAWAKAGGLA